MALFESRNTEKAAEGAGKRQRAPRRSVDSVDDMRRRARHRLIGACVLVLAAIIAFPMLFDAEPRPVAVSADVRVAGGDTALATPATSTARASGGSDAHGLADGEEVVDTSANVAVASSQAGGSGTNAGTTNAPSRGDAAATPTAPPPSVAQRAAQQAREEPRTAAAPTTTTPTTPPATPPASAPAQPAPAPKPAEPPVQVAAAAPPPPVQPPPAQSGASAREAERARALLEGRPVDAPAPASRSDEGRFIVQVGAFSDDNKVREIRQKLEGMGLRTYTQVVQTGGTRATRVRVGPFASRAEADRAAERVKGASLPAAIMSM